MIILLSGKSRRVLQYAHLLCCASNRTAQRMSIYASRFGFLRALHLNIFEQPKTFIFHKNRIMETIFYFKKILHLQVNGFRFGIEVRITN
ncbi:MAG TPA: hypothetical protein DDX93_02505 [Smithella sp.]|nr:hypothetical protein [Smithella sp.]